MDIQIRDAEDPDRHGIAEAIAEAFFDSFKVLHDTHQHLAQALAGGIDTTRFVVAVDRETGQVVGTVGISDEAGYAIRVDHRALREAFGWLKGLGAILLMEDEFYCPKVFDKGQGQIDFVAVRQAARGQRLATAMLRHLMDTRQYDSYTLEVIEGNEHVLPLYRSLGFAEIARPRESAAWAKGFHFSYRMRRDITPPPRPLALPQHLDPFALLHRQGPSSHFA